MCELQEIKAVTARFRKFRRWVTAIGVVLFLSILFKFSLIGGIGAVWSGFAVALSVTLVTLLVIEYLHQIEADLVYERQYSRLAASYYAVASGYNAYVSREKEAARFKRIASSIE